MFAQRVTMFTTPRWVTQRMAYQLVQPGRMFQKIGRAHSAV